MFKIQPVPSNDHTPEGERNPVRAFDPDLIDSVRVNRSAVERRAGHDIGREVHSAFHPHRRRFGGKEGAHQRHGGVLLPVRQGTAEQVIDDGEYAKIYAKYFPGTEIRRVDEVR